MSKLRIGGSLLVTAMAAAFAVVPQEAAGALAVPTVGVTTSSAVIGGRVTVTGTGWTTADGLQGSRVAVKLDDGAYSHKPGQGVTANLTVWAVIDAATDGSFTATLRLPTPYSAAPGYLPGPHFLRFLSGSLKEGDQPRSLRTADFAVGKAATTTTAKLSKAKIKSGTKGKLVVTARSSFVVRGAVVVKRGTKVVGRGKIAAGSPGSVTITLSKLAVGTHKLKATFAGTGYLKGSTSGTVTLTVVK